MAYAEKNLQVEYARGTTGPGSANFFRRATYITEDTAAQVAAASYFNTAAKRLPKGTVIQAVVDADATPELWHFIVTSNDGSTVVVAEASFTDPSP